MAESVRQLGVVVTHPIQYQAPLWRALQRDGRVKPTLLFLSRHGVEDAVDPNFGVRFAWDTDLLGGYESVFVPNWRASGTSGRFLTYVNPGLISALRRCEADAVLFVGLRNPSAIAGLVAALRWGIPCLYRAESSILDRRSALSRHGGGWLVKRAQAVLPIGTANYLYYDVLGYPEDRRFLAPYTVDNEFFRRQWIDRAAARDELGIGVEEFVVLYAGKLVPWKDPLLIVEACAAMVTRRPVRLLVAGDGVLRSELQRLAECRGVATTQLGFVNQSRLGLPYSAADAFVLPSRIEPWGLAVNEAMNFSLPVIVSSRVGARLDLVRPGENGAVIAPGSERELARVLSNMAEDPGLAAAWGRESRRLIGRWGLSETVGGVVGAVRSVA